MSGSGRSSLQEVSDPRTGFAFVLPGDWEVLTEPAEGIDLLACEPQPGERDFRANLVLTVVDNGGLSFRDWQAGTDELLPGVLTDYHLLDLERLPFAGHPGGRRLAHHVHDEAGPLTMEQWFTLVDGVGYTLTATVDTWRYDELADLFAGVAASATLAREVQ
jgi:hypothetical protein